LLDVEKEEKLLKEMQRQLERNLSSFLGMQEKTTRSTRE